MALFTLKIMCPAARFPPLTTREFQAAGTKRRALHNADFVPGNKIREFGQLRFIKEASWIGFGFADFRYRDVLDG